MLFDLLLGGGPPVATKKTRNNGLVLYVFHEGKVRKMARLFTALCYVIGAVVLTSLGGGLWEHGGEEIPIWLPWVMTLAVPICLYLAYAQITQSPLIEVSQSHVSLRYPTDTPYGLPKLFRSEVALAAIDRLEACSTEVKIHTTEAVSRRVPLVFADPGELVWAIREMVGREIPVVWTDEKPSLLRS